MRDMMALAAVVLAGCTQKAVLAPAELTVSPETLDFGVVPIESESTLDVTLTNTGDQPASVLTVSLTEGDPNRFEIDHSGVDTIEGGAEATLSITFLPRDVGVLETGQVQIRTDAADAPFLVSLSGTGGDSAADNDGDGYSAADGDCDDGDANQHPNADEICDGQDTDCNGVTPTDEADEDYDGYHLCDLDCDDHNGQVHPGAEEICDGLDNDCDLQIPDNLDEDSDGYSICDADCDDSKPNVNPGRAEVCDGDDNDCDTLVDNVDGDLDGHTLCSAAGDCDDNDPSAFPVVVSTSGSAYGTGTDTDPYDTIENGLAHLDTVCRTVVLEPGTYTDVAVDWNGGAVTIIGRTGNPADVTIQSPPYERQFSVDGATLTLQDLTIANGDADYDGGAIQTQNATLTLDHVVLSANSSGNDGGALAATSSTVVLLGAVFDANTAADDGGAMVIDSSTLFDDGSTFTNNTAVRGGAMYVIGGTLSLDGTVVRSNTASEGGGIAITSSGTYDIERSWLILNHATADGGGIAMRDVPSNGGSIRNDRFMDNTADGTGGAIAILGYSGAGRIVNNTMTGNLAIGFGGGIQIDLADGSGLVVENNVLHSNDGPAAMWEAPGAGAYVAYNTAYLTNSGVHFGGDLAYTYGGAYDTNVVRNPGLASFSDDANPDNDDVSLAGGSSEIDAGDPDPAYNDQNGSTNDRGYTGGPAAP